MSKHEEWKQMLAQFYSGESYDEICEIIDKAEKYELSRQNKLKKKLCCPLEVIERAFDNGFYDVDGNYYFCEHYVPYLKSMHTRGISIGREKHFKLKDYKKTWWLREDKIE